MNNYRFISVLRPVAALWVLVSHCLIWGGYSGYILPPKVAVDLFMIISGFLMSAMTAERSVITTLSFREWRDFVLKRYFRIAPAYYLSLFGVLLLGSFFLDGYGLLRHLNMERWGWEGAEIYDPANIILDLKNIVSHLTFVFGLSPAGCFSTFLPDWSLSLEMQFYVLFPLLWLLVKRYGIMAVGALALLVTALAPPVLGRMGLSYPEPSFLPLKLGFFVMGMVAYHLLGTAGWKRKAQLGAMILALLWVGNRGGALLVGAMAVGGFIGLLELERRGTMAWIQDTRILSWLIDCLSDMSYGIYLFHGFFISLAGHLLADWGLGATQRSLLMIPLVLFPSLMVAAIVQHWVEKPGIQLGRRLLAKR